MSTSQRAIAGTSRRLQMMLPGQSLDLWLNPAHPCALLVRPQGEDPDSLGTLIEERLGVPAAAGISGTLQVDAAGRCLLRLRHAAPRILWSSPVGAVDCSAIVEAVRGLVAAGPEREMVRGRVRRAARALRLIAGEVPGAEHGLTDAALPAAGQVTAVSIQIPERTLRIVGESVAAVPLSAAEARRLITLLREEDAPVFDAQTLAQAAERGDFSGLEEAVVAAARIPAVLSAVEQVQQEIRAEVLPDRALAAELRAGPVAVRAQVLTRRGDLTLQLLAEDGGPVFSEVLMEGWEIRLLRHQREGGQREAMTRMLGLLAGWVRQHCAAHPGLARLKDAAVVLPGGQPIEVPGVWRGLPCCPAQGSIAAAAEALESLGAGEQAWLWMSPSDRHGQPRVALFSGDADEVRGALAWMTSRAGEGSEQVLGIARRLPTGRLILLSQHSAPEELSRAAAAVSARWGAAHPALRQLGEAGCGQLSGGQLVAVQAAGAADDPLRALLEQQSAVLQAADTPQRLYFWLGDLNGEAVLVLDAERTAIRDRLKSMSRSRPRGTAGQFRFSSSGRPLFRAKTPCDGLQGVLERWVSRHQADWPQLRRLRSARFSQRTA